jgi:lysyl-tRNA synthetase class 2
MKRNFLPTASLERLRQRANILKNVRSFFDQREFMEVETPVLSRDTVIDQHIQPIGIPAKTILENTVPTSGEQTQLWLQTSPEFGMKRLLAAGADAIYQISKSFRAGERGRLHNPEFTMLEWYRVGDDMASGIELLAEFAVELLGKTGCQRQSYQQVFELHAGVDPHASSAEQLQTACQDHGLDISSFSEESNHKDFWLNLLLSEVIESKLGVNQPTIVYDWPASQSALAIVREERNPNGESVELAERFELYVDGVEIANGYHELLDADELARRNSINNQLRLKDGSKLLPEESYLLAAMQHGLPACAGVALGIDRLVMLATGANSIEEVMTFPFENA